MKKSLFIFRRDLRLNDNTGLLYALKHSDLVVPCFIFTPEQIDKNPYRSDHCLRFLLDSLEDLADQLKEKGGKLSLFKGHPEEVVAECIEKHSIDAVYANRDYTPYSIQRDKKIAAACKKHRVPFQTFDDALLHPPEETLKKDGKPYTIFTPYFKNASKLPVAEPVSNRHANYAKTALSSTPFPKLSAQTTFPGGRSAALKLLKKLGSLPYASRDFPAKEATSHLSPHLKFTTVSPREAYAAAKNHDLIRSLYWRDFFTAIAFFFPQVFKSSFHEKYDRLKWSYDKKAFQKWCEGKTGFPIIDAGMREMNETGFMHNRVRMIAASFLVKDLHIDWRWGEKYFAQTLIDYDPAVNNGNWQWAASTGCDAQPYFRIFNPWNQQKKFDPDCLYIKKWVPELKSLSPKIIHDPDADRPIAPICDHEIESKVALKAYRALA